MPVLEWILILLSFVIIIVLLLYMTDMVVSLIRSKWVPYVASFDKDITLMQERLSLTPGSTIVDLWCGDGKALRFFVQEYKFKQWVGYEISWHAWLYGKYLLWKQSISSINLIRWSLYTADLTKYDYIYCYLMPFVMKDIEYWVQNSINENTIIIVNTFPFPNRAPHKIIHDQSWKKKIYLYKKTP